MYFAKVRIFINNELFFFTRIHLIFTGFKNILINSKFQEKAKTILFQPINLRFIINIIHLESSSIDLDSARSIPISI